MVLVSFKWPMGFTGSKMTLGTCTKSPVPIDPKARLIGDANSIAKSSNVKPLSSLKAASLCANIMTTITQFKIREI